MKPVPVEDLPDELITKAPVMQSQAVPLEDLPDDVRPLDYQQFKETMLPQATDTTMPEYTQFPEQEFQNWYKSWADKTGMNPDPDDPNHFYDYRAAFKANVVPPEKGGHWPSQFKKEGHPRRYVDGIDTITGKPQQLKGTSTLGVPEVSTKGWEIPPEQRQPLTGEKIAEGALQAITEPWFERQPYDPNAGYTENVKRGMLNTMGAMVEGVALPVKFPAQVARQMIGEPLRKVAEGTQTPQEFYKEVGVTQPIEQVKGFVDMIVSGVPGIDPQWAESLFMNPDTVVFGKILARDIAKGTVRKISDIIDRGEAWKAEQGRYNQNWSKQLVPVYTEGQQARRSPEAFQESFNTRMQPEPTPQDIASGLQGPVKTMYNVVVAEGIQKGMPPEVATTQALERIANTPGGQQQIQEITINLAQQAEQTAIAEQEKALIAQAKEVEKPAVEPETGGTMPMPPPEITPNMATGEAGLPIETPESEIKPVSVPEPVPIEDIPPIEEPVKYNPSHLEFIRDRITASEPPMRVHGENMETTQAGGYPEWFRNKGYTRIQVTGAIKKALEGKELTTKQDSLLDEITRASIKEYEGMGKTKIYPDSLQEGQKVIINGEEFTRQGIDSEGKVILKDGETIKQDIFEPLSVDKVLPVEKQSGVKPIRFETGKKLTNEQRNVVLKNIGDSYKDLNAPVYDKGVDKRGEEIVGYEYDPEYMHTSDITGRKIRHYIVLPDKRKAHPSELFPNITKSQIDKHMAEERYRQEQERIFQEESIKNKQRRIVPFFDKDEANRLYSTTNRPLRNSYFATNKNNEMVRIDATDKGDVNFYTERGFAPMSEEPMTLTAETHTTPKIKPTQPDMFGIVEGTMEGKIPAQEAEFPLGQAMEEAKQRKVDAEMKERQGVLGETGFKPEEGFRRSTEEPQATEKPVKRSDIVKLLNEKLDVPIRTGRFRGSGRGVLGIFKLKGEVVRTKMANDIETIAHEIGHGLQKFLWPETVNAKQGAAGMKAGPMEPFRDELDPIASMARSKQDPITEGFAEFIRRYVTNEADAKKVAPTFYDFFEKELDAKSPEAKEILIEARKQFDRWIKQPSLARVLGQISVGEGKKPPVSLTDLYTATIDDLHPLKKAVEEMTKKEPIDISKDPYKLARLLRGWWGKADSFLEHKPFDFNTYEFKGKSLREILDPIKDNLDEFRAYILSKRALELKDRGIETGILPQDAKKVVADYGLKFGNIFENLKAYQDQTLQYLRDSGILDLQAYLKMKQANKDYIPFYRVMESAKGFGTGRGLEAWNPTKKIKGSWRDIVDPLESVIKNTYLYINLAEKNAVGKALVDLSESREGLGKFVEKIPTPLQKIKIHEPELLGILSKYGKWTETTQYRDIKTTVGEKITEVGSKAGESTSASEKMEKVAKEALMGRGWSEHEAQQVLDRIKKAPTAEIKSRIIEKTIEKITVMQTTKEFGLDLPKDVAEIFRPSAFTPKENVISVWRNGKRNLYQVDPEIARAMQALDKEQMNTIVKILSIPSRWLRAGATLTPEFILRNPSRDQFSAFVYSKYGYVPGVDLIRGIYHLLKKDDMYWKWKQSGGEHSMLVSMDREYLQKGLDNVLKGKGVFNPTNFKGVIKNPIEALRILSEFGEAGTRIGEFAKGIGKEGITKEGIQKGGFASREVTLDFARVGAKTKAVNSLIAFWNANVQGTDKMARAFKERPIPTLLKTLAAITLPSIILTAVNRQDERWKEIPQWQKDLFWIVMTKDNIWRIPKPFELGIIFGTLPERITEFVLDRDAKSFDGLLKTLGNGAAPGFIPTVMTPLIENWANRSFFLDRPIVPKGKEDILPQYQYQPYTTETAKLIGKALSHIPGVRETSAASPAKIDNLIRGWTGGLGNYAMETIDQVLIKSGVSPQDIKPSRTLSDIPLIKAFHVRYPSSDAESIRQFYDNYNKAQQIMATAKTLAKQGKLEEAQSVYESGNVYKINNIHTSLKNAHRAIDKIYSINTMTPEEKRKAIDEIYMGMIKIASEGNARLQEINSQKMP